MDGITDPIPPTNASQPSFKGIGRITRAFNGSLLYSCSIIALSQLNFGMDQGAFSTTQAMAYFTVKFGVYNPVTQTYAIEPYFLSLLNSLNYIGFAVGLVSGSFISRRYGRRICMFVMCIWALVAASILVSSETKAQILAGRIIAYVYIGMELALVPVLQSELVPAQIRGFVVSTYQSGLLVGTLIMVLICRRTSTIPSDASWRIPLGLLFIIPAIIACLVWFMPESPRWLLIKDRTEDALVSLRKLRRGRFSEEEILEEFNLLQSTINLTVEKGLFQEIFHRTNLKRTLIVVGTNVFLQITGQTFVSAYGTIYIASLLGTQRAFDMSVINVVISIVFVILTMVLTDRTGRKPLLIAGAVVQTLGLFAMGGLGTANPTLGIKQGITAMVTIFTAGFSLGWAPLSHVIEAEIPTSRLRDQTYAFGSVFNIIIQFTVAFTLPYLLNAPYANLGSKVGFIFGSFAFLAVGFSIFCVPECGGKSLEEIDTLFLNGVPVRQFRRARPVLQDERPNGKEFGKSSSLL